MFSIEENLKNLQIPPNVILLAVSKRKPAGMIREAYQYGVRNFGENYLQDAVPKIQSLQDLPDIVWHFIGHIQSNKIKEIVTSFDLIQSVDREKILSKIDAEAHLQQKVMPVLIQVNIGEESQKSGISPDQLGKFLQKAKIFSNLDVQGLMCIPPHNEDPRPYFKQMKHLFDQHKDQYHLSILSMGMSGDYQIAIEQGANLVRIGTSIFGEREN